MALTRSQRRARARARVADARRNPGRLAVAAVAAGITLDDNPNRSKRHAPRPAQTVTPVLRSDAGDRVGRTRAEYTGTERDQPYAPLTVTTRHTDSRGRRNPRIAPTSYTV